MVQEPGAPRERGRDAPTRRPRRGRSSAAPPPSRRAPDAPRRRAAPSRASGASGGEAPPRRAPRRPPRAREVSAREVRAVVRAALRSPAAIRARSASSGSPCALEPARGARSYSSHLGGRRASRRASANSRTGEPSEYQPTVCPCSSTNEPAPRERVERLRGVRDPQRLAERRGEALERRHRPHQRLDLGRLVREHLGGEVREQRPARARRMRSSVACRSVGGTPRSASTASRTAAGQPPVAAWSSHRRLRVGGSRERGQERRRLARVERQVGAGELEHLPLAAKALDRERQLGARGEDECSRGGAWRQSDSITCTAPTRARQRPGRRRRRARGRGGARLERLAECRREPARARRLVLLRARAGGGRDRAGRVDGQRGDAQPDAHPRGPARSPASDASSADAVYQAQLTSHRPVGEQRRLAEPGTGDDRRQPPLERAVEDRRRAARAGAGAPARQAGGAASSTVAGVRERTARAAAVPSTQANVICGPHTIVPWRPPRDPRCRAAGLGGPDGDRGGDDAGVRQDARHVLVVPRLLEVRELEPEAVRARVRGRRWRSGRSRPEAGR